MTEPNLIERVRKLLALADSSNKHEAASAMRAAQRLMTEHNISKAQLDAPSEGYHAAGVWQGRMPVWKVDLARAIAQVNGCVLYSQPLDPGVKRFDWFLVGDQQSSGAAAYLFTYVVSQITHLAAIDLVGTAGEFRHSYYQGITAFLIHELMRQQEQFRHESQGPGESRTSDQRARRNAALAVIDSTPDRVSMWLRQHFDAHQAPNKGQRRVEHEDAFVAGFSRGQLVDMGTKKLEEGSD